MRRGLILLLAACSSTTTPSIRPRGDLQFAPLDEDLAVSDVDLAGADLRSLSNNDMGVEDLQSLADFAVPSGDLLGSTSCKTLLAANPGLPSGTYTINPPSGTLSVYCDMSTDGGGWTLVFVPVMSNYWTATLDYQIPVSSTLWSDSTDALIAFRNGSQMILGDWARFAIPADWKVKAPFQYDTSDVTVSVVVSGGAASSHTLRYGKKTWDFSCTDPWDTSANWGRICIEGTLAPFYDGFDESIQDGCETSMDDYGTTACSNQRQFTIAIR